VSFIVLALDTAKKVSGAAVLTSDGRLLAIGCAKTQAERERFVRFAASKANARNEPLICVAEEWDKPRHRRKRGASGEALVQFDQKWTFKTVLGMGAGWGLWLAELERYGVRETVRVTPNTWRDGLFGKRRGKDTASAKAQALAHVKRVFAIDLGKEDDAAEAACIGLFALKNAEVLRGVESERRRIKRATVRKTSVV
jgi:hypothetical protein